MGVLIQLLFENCFVQVSLPPYLSPLPHDVPRMIQIISEFSAIKPKTKSIFLGCYHSACVRVKDANCVSSLNEINSSSMHHSNSFGCSFHTGETFYDSISHVIPHNSFYTTCDNSKEAGGGGFIWKWGFQSHSLGASYPSVIFHSGCMPFSCQELDFRGEATLWTQNVHWHEDDGSSVDHLPWDVTEGCHLWPFSRFEKKN